MTESDILHAAGPDGGPLYTETNFERWIVEPFNAATAVPFVLIAVYWLWRLRGQYRAHSSFAACILLLLVGGVGGVLFHAFRSSRVFFLMDVVPIGLLSVLLSLYLWQVVLHRWWRALPAVAAFLIAQRAGFVLLSPHLAISASYLLIALMLVLPLALVLKRTHFAYVEMIAASVALFVAGLFCRFWDPFVPSWLPMGSHWLWHLLAAGAVFQLAEYFFHLDGLLASKKSLSK